MIDYLEKTLDMDLGGEARILAMAVAQVDYVHLQHRNKKTTLYVSIIWWGTEKTGALLGDKVTWPVGKQ